MMKKEELQLVTEWDKTFPQSEKTEHSKVTFVNRYGITLAADMYAKVKQFFTMANLPYHPQSQTERTDHDQGKRTDGGGHQRFLRP